LGRAGVAAVKEPTGLLVGSNLRPDAVTLISWSRGKSLAWDATTPDTVAASHLQSTRVTVGAAAVHAAQVKDEKYSALAPTFIFVAVAVKTFGP